MRNRRIILAVISSILLAACATGSVQPGAPLATGAVDPAAGAWRTWVLGSGKDLRLPPPPDAQATAAELQQVEHDVVDRTAQARLIHVGGAASLNARAEPLELAVDQR